VGAGGSEFSIVSTLRLRGRALITLVGSTIGVGSCWLILLIMLKSAALMYFRTKVNLFIL